MTCKYIISDKQPFSDKRQNCQTCQNAKPCQKLYTYRVLTGVIIYKFL